MSVAPMKYAERTALGQHLIDEDHDLIVDHVRSGVSGGITQYPYDFLIRLNGAVYEGINSVGVLAIGGVGNLGGGDGSDLLDVSNAAVAALSEGIVVFQDLAIPATLTEKDGVICISQNTGVLQYKFTNPTAEVASVTNTQNTRMVHYHSIPTNDPPTLDAWTVLSAEIEATAAMAKYYVGGYFAGIARAGSAAYIWGLNPLVWLEAGCTGNAICIEADVNNYAAADKGEGVTVMGNNGNDLYSAFRCNSMGTARWTRGMILQKWHDYGIILVDDQTGTHEAIHITYDNTKTGVPLNVLYNNLNCLTLLQNAGAVIQYNRNHTGSDTDLIVSYDGADANPRFQVTTGGLLAWGAGGASAIDTLIYRDVANGLLTPDQLYAADGIVTKTKAGTISDADLTNTAKAGVLAIDTSNNRIYFKTAAATWKYCQADGGFVIPKEEKICGDCGKPITIGQRVCGKIESEMSDGSLHGLWVHLQCPE
jgi:hypothetical protein